MRERVAVPHSLARLIFDATLVGALLFAGAGTFRWPRAWVLLALMLSVRVIGACLVHRVHPALVRERARLPVHASQSWSDRVLLLGVLATGFLGLALVAGLDVWRWQLFARPHVAIAGCGLLLFAAGWVLKSVALHANAFAIAEVRSQRVHGQVLAARGVYGVIRHPFYAADLLILVGQGLWLESYAAALASLVPVALMVLRLQLEEQFLRAELPDYGAYARRVRYRLIPGVW
jgi:protein-S-isoprenylcysteine O-methyltransferase Ste14